MIDALMKKIFGDKHSKDLTKVKPVLDEVLEIYPDLKQMSDHELKLRVNDIRDEVREFLNPREDEIAEIEKKYKTESDEKEKDILGLELDEKLKSLKMETQEILDRFLPEVYAIVKDTCRRLVGHKYEVRGNEEEWFMVPFDVQIIGGIALHKGMIAEMATGEGKTLVATMPLFLNALTGKGTHLITVNDYLAQRDSEWMYPIFEFHGLTVGVITTGMEHDQRKVAYECDITYGTNSEFGFDYLRDNMATSGELLVQRNHFFAIIDEVDSVLIDEARTPLIISGPVAESKNYFNELKSFIQQIVNSQNMLINRTLNKAKNYYNEDDFDAFEFGKMLLICKRGAPKNKTLIKMLKEPDIRKILDKVEGEFIRDKKMHHIDEELFYIIEEKGNTADLCEKGREKLSEKYPDIFIVEQLDDLLRRVEEDENIPLQDKVKEKEKATSRYMEKNEKLHNISQLIKSYSLFEKDVDYVVNNNRVVIVDEFTGRMMPGRRFSDGLHQALEAKEGVKIENASQTLATITLQNFFKMYDKLAGMTGTAVTEEAEFMEIYKLPVMLIPTNVPVTRIDYDDMIYMTKREKYNAIVEEIVYWYQLKKPVLVGTVSVEVSEVLSRILKRKNVSHNVLNAKHHEREAEIIKSAGEPGSVTIATNMAGRGTDIKLGQGVVTENQEEYRSMGKSMSEDNPYGLPLDGLHVIGTERHESRRIDRQLRGRSGRQGDPGTTRFYLSLEDDLMRLFGSDRIASMIGKLGFEEGSAITHPWMTNSVEKAQKRVEQRNFEIRKQLIKYDEVMNHQREVIYKYRRNVLKGYDMKAEIAEMIKDAISKKVYELIDIQSYEEDWVVAPLVDWFRQSLTISCKEEDFLSDVMTEDILIDNAIEIAMDFYQQKESDLGYDKLREIERISLLRVVDEEWRDHLHEMDLLKEGISLRAYANKDPLVEYKKESFILFENLIGRIQENVAIKVFTLYIARSKEELINLLKNAKLMHNNTSAFENRPRGEVTESPEQFKKIEPRKIEKIGRNEPCPCGSGKKYKKCCGNVEQE